MECRGELDKQGVTWVSMKKPPPVRRWGSRSLTRGLEGAGVFVLASASGRARTFARQKSFTTDVMAMTGAASCGDVETMSGDDDLIVRRDSAGFAGPMGEASGGGGGDAGEENDPRSSTEW